MLVLSSSGHPVSSKRTWGPDEDDASTPEGGDAAAATDEEQRYEERGLLGRGGMGEVSRVYDKRLGRVVAMKGLTPEAANRGDWYKRFLREAKLTAQLQHPGIIPVHDLLQGDFGARFTMKEVAGRTFGDVLKELHEASSPGAWAQTSDGWTFERVFDAFGRVCEAVAYAHNCGVIHRDLKPDNIMLGGFGETLVLDWGLARRFEEREDELTPITSDGDGVRTVAGGLMGTPQYMSPEQAQGCGELIDPRSDVWSLGVILYELLMGVTPMHNSDAQGAIENLRSNADIQIRTRPPRVPPELMAIVKRALSKNRDQRYADAGALGAEVRAWLDGNRVHAYEYSMAELLGRFIRRNRMAVAVGTAGAVLLLVIAGTMHFRVQAQRDRARGRDPGLAVDPGPVVDPPPAADPGLGGDPARRWPQARR